MHCTDVERPKARKPHRCMSCGEGIAATLLPVHDEPAPGELWQTVTAQLLPKNG